jgi:hypothetical protein
MSSLVIAFISVVIALWTRSYKYAKRIERTRRIYKEEGIEFPFQTMAAVDSQILFHRQRFIDSSESDRLKEERIELCEDYKSANISPLKCGLKVFAVLLPIEIIAWLMKLPEASIGVSEIETFLP